MSRARVSIPILLLALAAPAWPAAQERRTAGGPPPYDLAAEKTVTGKLAGTGTIAPPDREPVMYLSVTAGSESFNVILGPAEWVKKQGVTFTAGAAVEVTGVPGLRLNGPAMMARTVKVGAKTLTLRDAAGKPKWEGGQP